MSPSATTSAGVSEIPANSATQAEIGYPKGHLGHLSQAEQDAMTEFKELLILEGLYTSATDGKLPSHSDATLLRFLRARRFVPKDALQQFRDTEQWRRINDLEDLYLNIDVDDFDETRRYYTHSIGRRDKRGFPVCLLSIGALDSKAMSAYLKSTAEMRTASSGDVAMSTTGKTPPRLLRLFAIYEYLTNWMGPLCTALTDRSHPDVPITQSSNIVDISNVGLRQFWSLRTHMQDATTLATAHYPEILDRIFIVGAPYFFPTVWSWVKRLFDPITASKIFILSESEVFPTLSQFMTPENIPKRYGGSLDFEFGDVPTVDPAFAERLTWKDDGSSGTKTAKGELRRWPRGPVKWVVREDGDWDLLAVGSVEGKPRRDLVATLKVGNDLGGWADTSMPHPKQRATKTVDDAASSSNISAVTANDETANGETANGDTSVSRNHAT